MAAETGYPENYYLSNCVKAFEEHLNWGPVSSWTNFDFEKLGDEIFSTTGVRISVTTLKRIFGKLKYKNDPSVTTLNTLVSFLGYSDWREFMQAQKAAEVAGDKEFDKKSETKLEASTTDLPIGSNRYVLIFMLLLIGGVIIFSFKKLERYDPADFEFSADKMISEGVPNSVVFTYDATKADSDSIYIVQTWDIRRKTKVAKNQHKHSAIYYYPGFFRTRLIVDDQIVRSHDLQITSGGWLGLIEGEDKPFYFKKEEILIEEGVRVDENLLAKYNYSLTPETPRVRFFNQDDLGDLMNDNFSFETELKNEFDGGTNRCQYVEVLIQCKSDIIIIPLCAKACIGEASLYFLGESQESVDSDLSGFGADLNQWTSLKVNSKNKQVKIIVNDQLAASFEFPNEPTGIVGVQYRFNGVGEVKYARFKKGNNWLTLQ